MKLEGKPNEEEGKVYMRTEIHQVDAEDKDQVQHKVMEANLTRTRFRAPLMINRYNQIPRNKNHLA